MCLHANHVVHSSRSWLNTIGSASACPRNRCVQCMLNVEYLALGNRDKSDNARWVCICCYYAVVVILALLIDKSASLLSCCLGTSEKVPKCKYAAMPPVEQFAASKA